ncbi:MAG: sulfite exporter TauE/SafE family protein [Saprospiraceae bacterium]|nr:sulfite exporter TauE/SafE family protein [Saprospiraceae bacterium]
MITDLSIDFYIFLSLIAFLYASIGHGGASGYLALMALYNFQPSVMRPTALLLNIAVALVSFLSFYNKVKIDNKLFLALISTSIPLAFVGGHINLDTSIYRPLLGIILIIPIIRLITIQKNGVESDLKEPNLYLAALIGAVIGFISGIIGIGGGILLSPILLWLRWSQIKQTAIISALFIFVNSIAGLYGNKGMMLCTDVNFIKICLVAIVSGIIGARLGATRFNTLTLRYILAVVLLVASFKLIFT